MISLPTNSQTCPQCRARWKRRWTLYSATTRSCSEGDVFTEEVLRTYVDYKRTKEVDAVRLRPHPYEFALYYDI